MFKFLQHLFNWSLQEQQMRQIEQEQQNFIRQTEENTRLFNQHVDQHNQMHNNFNNFGNNGFNNF